MTGPSLILVGGGLANGLLAWRLAERRPEVRVTILERGDRLGGNNAWSSLRGRTPDGESVKKRRAGSGCSVGT